MSGEILAAISEALDELSSMAGRAFVTSTGECFTAWPSLQPRPVFGKVLQSPDLLAWFQMLDNPTFVVGDIITGSDGKKYTVRKRLQNDPHTNTILFAILPGRITTPANSSSGNIGSH